MRGWVEFPGELSDIGCGLRGSLKTLVQQKLGQCAAPAMRRSLAPFSLHDG